MNDIEMIKNIRNGSEDDFNLLLKKYHNLIYKIINNFNLRRGEYAISKEDLFQEASMALYDACLTYHFDSNASFTTFAYMIIKRKIMNKYRDYTLPYRFEITSYDINNSYEFIPFENKVADPQKEFYREELLNVLSKQINKLDSLDKKIINLRAKDLTYKEISERLNISYKKVDNRIYKLRKILSKYT